MRYAKINLFDIANGPGIRVSLFVSGCNFHCKGCFNQEAWDFNYGKEFTGKETEIILERLKHKDFSGLSILGGDPMWQSDEGISQLITLCKEVHKLNKTVWIWSGFYLEEILSGDNELRKELLNNCDFLVDGRFELDKRDITLAWRGSRNQNVVNLAEVN